MADEKDKIAGYQRDLSEGREVFVGHRGESEEYYIRFKNAEGNNTFLKISPEAFDALISLKGTLDRGGGPYWCFKHEGGNWVPA